MLTLMGLSLRDMCDWAESGMSPAISCCTVILCVALGPLVHTLLEVRSF
jgi:hypothetical protein